MDNETDDQTPSMEMENEALSGSIVMSKAAKTRVSALSLTKMAK